MDTATLLARCREGNELAWEALVRQHQARVYGIALHYLGDAEDARDTAQEIFVRIFKNLDRCPDADRFVPWMIRIARNACVDQLRRRRARPPGRDIPVAEAIDLAAAAPDPAQAWAAASRRNLVQRPLHALGRLSQEVLLLKEIHGLSFEEVAEILDVPVGTVKSRSNRARLELARKVLDLSGGTYGAEQPR